MKSVHFIILFLTLQFLGFITLTTAKYTTFPEASRLPNLLYTRTEDSSSNPYDFVCESSPRSPFNNHAIYGVDEMGSEQGHRWCTQDNRGNSMCKELFKYGTAVVAMCGEYRAKVRCNVIVDAVKQLSEACAKKIDGDLRLAGRAIFKWGYVEVSEKQISD